MRPMRSASWRKSQKKFQQRALAFAGSEAERELTVQTMKRYNQYAMMLMYEQNAAQLENS